LRETEFPGTVLLRTPQRNKDIVRTIEYQFGQLGYKGKFAIRSPEEQYQFNKNAFAAGLRVVPPYDIFGKDTYYPFVENAKPLDTFFQTSTVHERAVIVHQFCEDMEKAHTKGFIYGDRIIPNMLISPQSGLVHVDFDVELSGNTAKEMDLANGLYAFMVAKQPESSLFISPSSSDISVLFAKTLATMPPWLDMQIVANYLRGFVKIRQKLGLENLDLSVESFIALYGHYSKKGGAM
jgi:hypothetical protein